MSDFLDPRKEIEKHGSKLPHWQQGEAVQFVTFRLGDSLPAGKLRAWSEQRAAWLRFHPHPWDEATGQRYHERFTRRIEDWLDQGHGSCLLRNPANRRCLRDTLMKDHGDRVEHLSWVIMPNHVHLLLAPRAPLDQLLKTWKGVSSRRIGSGSIWQRNYRDTLIRHREHLAAVVRYIRRNPANLPPDSFTLWESDRAKGIR